MDLRTRILTILKGEKPDMVPWFGDLDYWMAYLRADNRMPEKYQGDGMYQLHRDLNVGFYLQGYFPFTPVYEGVEITKETHGHRVFTRVKTPYGELREEQRWLPESFCWAFPEHFIKNWRDLKAYRYWYEHTHYEPDYQLAADRYELIGDYGVVLCYLPRSPMMTLVAVEAGIETVTYAIADAPEEFAETFAVLKKKTDEASEVALNSPAECLMIPENLSSEVIGKRMFHKYLEEHQCYWTKRIKDAGKYSFVHLDGTMQGLVREVSSTGFRVMEALTPAPVGDIEIEDLDSWVADSALIWGGIPGVYFTDLVSDEDFDAFVIRVLQVMRAKPRYVLGVADQVPPRSRFERIASVNQLVEQHGYYK